VKRMKRIRKIIKSTKNYEVSIISYGDVEE